MRYLQLLRITIAIIFVLCNISMKNVQMQIKKTPQPLATILDSLQGKWVNLDNSLNQITIDGKNWNERYNDTLNPTNQTLKIYFSDTLVQVDNFQNAVIDTTALSGNYIITTQQSDNSMECWRFNGFHNDSTGITFSITPPNLGTMSSTLVFKKIQ